MTIDRSAAQHVWDVSSRSWFQTITFHVHWFPCVEIDICPFRKQNDCNEICRLWRHDGDSSSPSWILIPTTIIISSLVSPRPSSATKPLKTVSSLFLVKVSIIKRVRKCWKRLLLFLRLLPNLVVFPTSSRINQLSLSSVHQIKQCNSSLIVL